MASSPEYVEWILDQMRECGTIRSKKMFGGVGIYIDEVFCALISSQDRFFLRTGPDNIAMFEQAGMESFSPMGGKGLPYHEVPEEVVEDPSELANWVCKARLAGIKARS